MHVLTDLSLLSGPVPLVVTVIGGVGGIWLLTGRARWFRRRAIPLAAAGAGVLTGCLWFGVERVWRPLPDPIPLTVYLWVALALWAVALLVPRILTATRRVRAAAVSVVAAVAVVVAGAVQVNLFFAAYPTVETAVGLEQATRIDFRAVPPPTPTPISGRPVESVWTPPADMPRSGRVTAAIIPGDRSGFSARRAEIYLPPAYFTEPRPQFPVLVLLAGQPGQPKDWLTGGRLAATMDDFARHHGGLGPVVVVADSTGSTWGNPLCVDSRLGHAATYLAEDVPAWTTAHLQVDPDPGGWAIGGLSLGGTCALQMATNYPQRYPTFLDLSGDPEPTLGDHQRTLDAAFGGKQSAFTRVNPLDLLAAHRYPGSAGVFVVGSHDDQLKPRIRTANDAARRAGMDVSYAEVRGGHNFAVWSAGLSTEMDWLARRLGLIS
ncbi:MULTISPECIES: alpha/beta hydrolase family protein [unclassified Rhodococcus (in: high G+C Gram-positive bacteria)]|uniref:alpha/beta hydrolase n=1 Tax=unclassified Rhodococcus (in: high G+C Gram-positive bacteria) TaxID=192944 RepID=UPI00163989BF|nr:MULTISPECIES: alpha/beta hydrolase-fold protein [unclassified Rhodococcus (in: high G+C Gram-positive bacteria)]MBC2638255.1 esterase [Rhodococcus sp. 3A]MBC2897004.1 esterase [Rhodococcus sp. 4CII]